VLAFIIDFGCQINFGNTFIIMLGLPCFLTTHNGVSHPMC
jgi:hypothetical protein